MKYLIFAGSGIGDMVIVLPMTKRIKEADPQSTITVFCKNRAGRIKVNNQLYELQNCIDDYCYYALEEIPHTLAFIARLGYKRFDYGFVAQYDNNKQTSLWPARIVNFACKYTIGLELTDHPSATFDQMVKRKKGIKASDQLLLMLDQLRIGDNKNIYCDLFKTEKLQDILEKMIIDHGGRYVSLVLGAGAIVKDQDKKRIKAWPYEHWHTLACMFIDAGYKVFLLGGREERDALDLMVYEWPDGVFDLCGSASIAESLTAQYASDLIIGCDTGLMHCAGALDRPSLTLYGPTDYTKYLPYGTKAHYIRADVDCSPCFETEAIHKCTSFECMKSISAQQVFAYATTILDNES